MIAPETNITLLKVPIEIDNINQLTFSNPQNQYNYFNNLKKLQYDKCTYQRKDNVIRFETNPEAIDGITYEDLLEYNYCMYQNSKYSDKWFYAFITDITYQNDGRSDISIKTDVWQTWGFDVKFKMSFVEREIIPKSEDTIGANTYPENVETGDIITNGYYTDPNLDIAIQDTRYVIGATVDVGANLTNDKLPFVGGCIYNGVFSGVKYYAYDRTEPAALINFIKRASEKGQADTITGLFIAPKFVARTSGTYGGECLQDFIVPSYLLQVNKVYGFQGYNPKNNKLRTYPFTYMIGTNSQGESNIYKYELFSTNKCEFNVKGVLSPGCSIRLTPNFYNGSDLNDSEGINLGKFPICNYSVDMYTNWLSQNSVNIMGNTITSDSLNMNSAISGGLLGTLSSAMSGNALGVASSVIGTGESIASAMIQRKQHYLMPPSINGNINSGDIMTASNKNTFKFYFMSVKREFAEKIDSYFSAYGYAINQYKIPNLYSRNNWNYIKTNGLNIIGDIPQSDLQEIKAIFNNGVTLWHNPNTFLDYSQNNV